MHPALWSVGRMVQPSGRLAWGRAPGQARRRVGDHRPEVAGHDQLGRWRTTRSRSNPRTVRAWSSSCSCRF